mmetsp:Transcript_101207/g.163266  ORF Transcript_101207/g.163266 Transcript_101207/m.163266 type:complete len:357 (+) Transcript_101207:46-1116(+)
MALPSTYVDGFHNEASVRQMEYRALGDTGMVVSTLGFGASALAGVFHEVTQDECIQVVHHTLKAGVNIIDSAPWYGQGKSESVLGLALKDVPRKAFYINTKVGRYLPEIDAMFDFSSQRVTLSVEESLQRLQLEYIDTIQIHDLEFAPNLDIIVNQTLPALDRLRSQGKVRKVGITGYSLAPILEVLSRSSVKIDIVLSYARMTLLDDSLATLLLPTLEQRQIGIINAAPTGMGLLTPQGPPVWHPASEEIKSTARKVHEHCAARGVSVARLALKTSLRDTRLPTTLISFAKLSQMEENLTSAREPMTQQESDCLKELYSSNILTQGCQMHWEGIEVAKYWEKLGKKLLIDKLYSA